MGITQSERLYVIYMTPKAALEWLLFFIRIRKILGLNPETYRDRSSWRIFLDSPDTIL
jgi:hypothetical protein